MKLATIATLVGISATLIGGYTYDLGQRAQAHGGIEAQFIAGDVELDLQRIDLELKLHRTIEERRSLTPDEQDRRNYLIELRAILVSEQRENV